MIMGTKQLFKLFFWGIVILFTSNSYAQLGSLSPKSIDQNIKSDDKKLEKLEKQISTIGKLDFKENFTLRYLDSNRLKKNIAEIFEAEYPKTLAEKECLLLNLMGFTRNETPSKLRNTRKRLFMANVSGFYYEKNKELLVPDRYRSIDLMNSMILALGLRHVLQDQHFNLSTILAARPGSVFDDRRLAILAAIKGDATFLMVQFSKLDPEILTSTPTADALMSFLPIAKPSLMYRESMIIKYQLLMPYINGLRFVNSVFKKKKWKGVNRILQHPPTSTEQILHPEKYFKREMAMPVSIQYQPEGYRLIHTGVIGEYYLNILLSKDDYSFRDYAQGWGGDTIHILKKGTSNFLVWESLWDKAIYCSNFYSDFKRFIENRYNVHFKEGIVKGMNFIAGQSSRGNGYFFLRKDQNKIFFVRSNDRDQMNAFIYGGNYD